MNLPSLTATLLALSDGLPDQAELVAVTEALARNLELDFSTEGRSRVAFFVDFNQDRPCFCQPNRLASISSYLLTVFPCPVPCAKYLCNDDHFLTSFHRFSAQHQLFPKVDPLPSTSRVRADRGRRNPPSADSAQIHGQVRYSHFPIPGERGSNSRFPSSYLLVRSLKCGATEPSYVIPDVLCAYDNCRVSNEKVRLEEP